MPLPPHMRMRAPLLSVLFFAFIVVAAMLTVGWAGVVERTAEAWVGGSDDIQPLNGTQDTNNGRLTYLGKSSEDLVPMDINGDGKSEMLHAW